MFEDPADKPEDDDHQQTTEPSAGLPTDNRPSNDDRPFSKAHTSTASAAVASLKPKAPTREGLMTLRSAKGRTTEVADVQQNPTQFSDALPTQGSDFPEAFSPGSTTGPMAGQTTEASRRMAKEATSPRLEQGNVAMEPLVPYSTDTAAVVAQFTSQLAEIQRSSAMQRAQAQEAQEQLQASMAKLAAQKQQQEAQYLQQVEEMGRQLHLQQLQLQQQATFSAQASQQATFSAQHSQHQTPVRLLRNGYGMLQPRKVPRRPHLP